ncbi:hypothetical protein CDL12_17866 [Handroanthus impetiginosus]|uniref:J domain-containing protein n=1 Tax=Handroanthus impetiginosus TaxID=429701 RepID=A0A2G9GWH7_9LAMI|nr:hypothetical protein CDL12_17866 [Handroanthus impetiginosus]
MAAEEDKNSDFYAVLGLKKECTTAELRNAYKKLAMKWHPDRFSASGNSKYVEEAKKKFQAIQEAYSVHIMSSLFVLMYVLSDANKRFLYDVGVYDCDDDDDENGMGEFLNEMATMMSQAKSNETGNETFEELQELFDEMFQSDIEAFGCSSRSDTPPPCSSSPPVSCDETYSFSNKRNSTEMSSSNLTEEPAQFEGFCIGTGGASGRQQGCESSRRKNSRKGRR